MKRYIAPVFVTLLLASSPVFAHPGSDSKCESCHLEDSSDSAPKVIPKEPGFFAKLFSGKKVFKGHEKISCVGSQSADGKLTGCHDIAKNYRSFLAVDTKDKVMDVFCGACHTEQREFGAHHPSYQADKNGDGVGDSFVKPAQSQEIYTAYLPTTRGEPLSSFPDAMVFTVTPEGKKNLNVAMPLGASMEVIDKVPQKVADLVQCTTCHNPHYGYLAAVGEEEALKKDAVARATGDVGLRMRDYNNDLCLACH